MHGQPSIKIPKTVLFPGASRLPLGPTRHTLPWVQGLFPRGQSGRFVTLTTPSNAGVKNANICTSTPPVMPYFCAQL